MTTPFENFVNIALGKSLSADVTLPTADDIPVFTGIGRQVTGKTTTELGIAEVGDLAAVATSGSYNDLSNTPTIPAAQVNADWGAGSGVAQILNKPTLGTAAAQNVGDFATAAQGTKADSALQPASMLYSFNPQTGTTYTLVAGDVTASGTVIVTCTNASSITVSLPTPSSLEVATVSSVNFRQGGEGVITFGGAATLIGKVATYAIYDTVTLVAYNTTTWLRIGG